MRLRRLVLALAVAGGATAVAAPASATPCPGQVAVVLPGGLGHACVPVQQWRYCAEQFAADLRAGVVYPAGLARCLFPRLLGNVACDPSWLCLPAE